VTTEQLAGDDTLIINTASITDGAGTGYQPVATTTVRVPPFIVASEPMPDQIGVPLTSPLVITLSEPVITSTFYFTITPDPGDWAMVWSPDSRVVTLDHADWTLSQTYSVTVEVTDLDDRALVSGPVPNSWSFTARGPLPYVVKTSPADGATGVPITATLVITFSEPMIASTLLYTVTPDPQDWSVTWSSDDTMAMLGHNSWFCLKKHDVMVTARNKENSPLTAGPVPNSWSFATRACRVYLPLLLKGFP
jgi:hypothetical protein